MVSGANLAESSPHQGIQADFRQNVESWRRLLKRCGRKPDRKCVHSLRVATLRLQAAIEYWHERQGMDAPVTGAVQRWLRQGKKLRRALGPVRQADVSLNKLARMRAWSKSDAGGSPVLPKECLGVVEEIERIVKRRREAAAKKLVAEIQKRRKRLNRLSRKLESALEGFAPEKESGAADKILAQIASVAPEFSTLDTDNLHKFRKRIKKIRYLAEFFAPFEETAVHYGSTLKRMTGSVGEWHDWQVLTEEAARAEHGDAEMAGAAEFLQAQASRSLEQALKLCRQSMTRLLKDTANAGGLRFQPAGEPLQLVPRKPVLKVSAVHDAPLAERPARAS